MPIARSCYRLVKSKSRLLVLTVAVTTLLHSLLLVTKQFCSVRRLSNSVPAHYTGLSEQQTVNRTGLSQSEPDELPEYEQEWIEGQMVDRSETYRPWPNDTVCRHHLNRFAAHLPVCILASFPSSGSTWLRYLVESATAIFTGSEYGDMSLFDIGMLGELMPPEAGWTLTQKTHGASVGPASERDARLATLRRLSGNCGRQQLLLVRHPASALVATRHYDNGGHVGHAPPTHFSGPDWDTFVRERIPLWTELYREQLLATCAANRTLVVVYEQLAAAPVQQLRRVLRFLDVPFAPGRLQCLQRHMEGRQRRKRRTGDRVSVLFNKQQQQLVNANVLIVNSILASQGKPVVPTDW